MTIQQTTLDAAVLVALLFGAALRSRSMRAIHLLIGWLERRYAKKLERHVARIANGAPQTFTCLLAKRGGCADGMGKDVEFGE